VTKLASIVSGRRMKWAVIAAWIMLLAIFASQGSKLADETNNETESFLPASAESAQVLNLLEDRFQGGKTTEALIVYRRPGGLTAADRRKIETDARRVARALPG
jgi:RND superfamily putative drug exporter